VKVNEKFEGSDVMDLVSYCGDAKKTCSKFQYAYALDDEERRLEHIFLSSSSCFDWYQNMVILLYLILG